MANDSVSQFLHNAGLLYDVMAKADDYNFQDKVVQFDDDPNNVASGEATIIFSGPPVLSKATRDALNADGSSGTSGALSNVLVPIGAVQGFQDSETPNVVPFPEIGSRLKRYAVGMATYQVSMSRVITMHSNLRNALYAWIALIKSNPLVYRSNPGEDYTNLAGAKDTAKSNGHLITSESDLMRVPFGLLLVTMSAGGHKISREYYEKCYIQNIGKAVAAGQPLIQENVSITCTRKVPCNDLTMGWDGKQDPFSLILGQNDSRGVAAGGTLTNPQ